MILQTAYQRENISKFDAASEEYDNKTSQTAGKWAHNGNENANIDWVVIEKLREKQKDKKKPPLFAGVLVVWLGWVQQHAANEL